MVPLSGGGARAVRRWSKGISLLWGASHSRPVECSPTEQTAQVLGETCRCGGGRQRFL